MSDQNVQEVQQAYAAFGRGDIDGILSRLTDDVDWQFLGPLEIPTAGVRHGKAAVAKFFQQVNDTWQFERFEPRQFIAQGDMVVALGYYSGTVKASRRPFASEWAHVFTMKGGKATRFREYADTANLLGALALTVKS